MSAAGGSQTVEGQYPLLVSRLPSMGARDLELEPALLQQMAGRLRGRVGHASPGGEWLSVDPMCLGQVQTGVASDARELEQPSPQNTHESFMNTVL